MPDLNTTLLREKFIIRDLDGVGAAPIVAVSNRLVLPLMNDKGQVSEVLVIRAQTMYSCIRVAAQLLRNFIYEGPLAIRAKSLNFPSIWDRVCAGYESSYNLARWVCVYHKGNEILSAGSRHSFLDIIEKCDAKNPGNYDRAVQIAEEAFLKMGRKVAISYESNIGMVMNVRPDMGRCGLVHRGPDKSSTFNFSVEPAAEKDVSPVMCLNVCAAYLEGLQLAYKAGVINDKLRLDLVDRSSSEFRMLQSAFHRLSELGNEIEVFDTQFDVKYRPDKPQFQDMIASAERNHRKMHEARGGKRF